MSSSIRPDASWKRVDEIIFTLMHGMSTKLPVGSRRRPRFYLSVRTQHATELFVPTASFQHTYAYGPCKIYPRSPFPTGSNGGFGAIICKSVYVTNLLTIVSNLGSITPIGHVILFGYST